MAWVPENIRALRRAIEGGAPEQRVTGLIDEYNGRRLVVDCEAGWRSLAATRDELGCVVDSLEDNANYGACGIRTKSTHALVVLASEVGSHAEAGRLVAVPLKGLLIKIDEASGAEKARLHSEVALLRLVEARIAKKEGNLMKFFTFLKLACDSARKSPQSSLSMLAFRQFQKALDDSGELEAAAAIKEEIAKLSEPRADWATNDWLWRL